MGTPSVLVGLEMNDFIPFPAIPPRKWAAKEIMCSYPKKGISSINISTVNEDSGLGMDADQTRRPFEKCLQTLNAKRCLFSIKRSLELTENISSESKRFRDKGFSPMPSSWKIPANLSPSSDPTFAIIDAVNRMTFESDLIADGSRTYSLPTVPRREKDMRCITTDTMAAVLRGDYVRILKNCTIIDCRYPYEFEGGHIKGAMNLYTKEMMQQFLRLSLVEKYDTLSRVLIFHCEFSLERGPAMYHFLREQDRILNKDKYPHLCYPEVYLLERGYKAFYENHTHYCEPMDYKPMLHNDHTAELRHFKIKSKSWNSGDKRQCRQGRHKLIF
ncbi:hypothetical protein ACJMK2_013063 [Sinanodonta woodiana]|uniref:M-phase inducer phosphatase n=1 Tax=Sinanodonta woodiana TaxID=1069815 RepID=A0ABD3VA71_SINWO